MGSESVEDLAVINVELEGPHGQIDPRAVAEAIELEGLTSLETPESRVSLDDVIGLFGSDWTEGMDSVDWVRRQRG